MLEEARLLELVERAWKMASLEATPITARPSLKLDFPPETRLRTVRQQLGQALVNLFVNAIQAMEATPGSVRVTAAIDAGGTVISVFDSGPGIPVELRERVFDPFFTTRTVGKGKGLGLSVAYGLVRGLGGTITVDSNPPRGAVLQVRLPAVTVPKE